MQNIQAAKYELIQALGEGGLAIFNGDNTYTKALFRQCKKVKRMYTTDPLAEPTSQGITIESIKYTPEGMDIMVREGVKDEKITTVLNGKHNVANLLAAITVARSLGMDYNDIRKAVADIKPPKHTLRMKPGIKESTVIDDTYSGNYDGVVAALEVLRRMKGRQKICVIQPLIELGSAAERIHKDIGTKIAESCDWCIVTSSDYFPQLYREALDAGMSKDSIFCLPKAHEALRKAQEITDKDDIILLENRVPAELLAGLVIRKIEE